MKRRVLTLADRVRAIATTGLHFSDSHWDQARYRALMEVAAELGAVATGDDVAPLAGIYRFADEGYVTPKIDVRLAVFRGDDVLLVRERADGRWAMPGGYIDVGDRPSEAAVRETLEEAGVEARIERLAGVFDNRAHADCPAHLFHIHKLVFTGVLVHDDSRPTGSAETFESGFHPVDALPELSMGRTLPLHVREALRVHRDASAAPYFD